MSPAQRLSLCAAALVAAVGLLSAADSGPASPPAPASDPYVFGTLETLPEHAAAEAAAGVGTAMIEFNWSAYEPREGVFDEAYAGRLRDRLAALRGAGLRVTLGLGLHYTPAWLLAYPGSRLVDQHGNVSASANLIFNQRLRDAAERYLARLARDAGLDSVWAVRLNSGAQAEVLYPPGGGYWAFDGNAQNGPDLPRSMAANPRPGWRPGDRTLAAAGVRGWADWYVHALDDVVTWQMRYLDGLGFTGFFQVLTPGAGTKPGAYARDVAARLPDGVTGVGAVWATFYAALPAGPRVVAYVSSMADEPARPGACTAADRDVALTDPRVDAWPATRWLARLAREYRLPLSGENPGWNFPARLNGHYADRSAAGMMAAAAHEMISCGMQGMYWAHDRQLWDGTVAFQRYADVVAAANHRP